jgi:hypothetical protein
MAGSNSGLRFVWRGSTWGFVWIGLAVKLNVRLQSYQGVMVCIIGGIRELPAPNIGDGDGVHLGLSRALI